jgi:xanthine dehydrogenase accessory factor
MTLYFEKTTELISKKIPFVSVILVDTLGSTPQNEGAKMLVTSEGLFFGTVGGGKVEKKCLELSQNLLLEKNTLKKTHFFQWNLNKDVGMTCGGSVRLYFEVFNQNIWDITIFGAGHVAQALIRMLLTLDCHITCIDSRREWLEKLPKDNKLTIKEAPIMMEEVKNIPENTFVILMTMGHTTDKPILLEILKTRTFPYIGVIGSKAKAKTLYKDIEETNLPESSKELFYCPIGLDIGTNDVNEIAISIIAQLLQERDKKLTIKENKDENLR